MNSERGERTGAKKPFVKPVLTAVRYEPNEVVLGACKQAGSTARSKAVGRLCRACGSYLGS